MKDPTAGRSRPLDALAVAVATRRACDRHVGDVRLAGLEIYRRAAIGVRVELAAGGRRVEVGREDGCAVRVRPAGGEAVHAAAVTSDERAVECCIDEALRAAGSAPVTGEWDARPTGDLRDLDEGGRLPSPGEVESLVERARDAAEAAGVASVVRASLRVVRTVECCANDRGLTAVRERIRTWAILEPGPAPGFDTALPVVAALRGGTSPAPSDWAGRLAARRVPLGTSMRLAPGGRVVVLAPEPAALVAELLVRMNRAPGSAVTGRAGRGFAVMDDPRAPGALFGGTFDDVGHAAHLVDLTVAAVPAVGRLRRASFRDRPVPMALNLIVRPLPVEPPPDRLWVTGLGLRRIAGDEVALVLRGTVVERGIPVAPFSDAVVRIPTDVLERRCVGGAGPDVASHHGVTTPALVFDGLEVLSM